MTGPSFRFRLERVRAVREGKKRLAQQELADALSRRSHTVAELRRADDDLELARTEQRSAAGEPRVVSASELLAHQAFLERIEAKREMHARELEQREAEVAERDARLTSAASEHEMLNRLRERHRSAHNRELARLESNVLDEMAATRFRRGVA